MKDFFKFREDLSELKLKYQGPGKTSQFYRNRDGAITPRYKAGKRPYEAGARSNLRNKVAMDTRTATRKDSDPKKKSNKKGSEESGIQMSRDANKTRSKMHPGDWGMMQNFPTSYR